MSLQFYRDNQLRYFKRKKEELEAMQTRTALTRLRRQMLERQKILNVQNELRMLESELLKSNNKDDFSSPTIERIKNRKNNLINIFKEGAISKDLYNIQ